MSGTLTEEEPASSPLDPGAKMVYAVVPRDQAETIAEQVMKIPSPGRPLVVQVHKKAELDDLDLPEYATEAVQGWKLALSVGSAAGLLAGWLTGLMGWVQGVGAFFGALMGIISGFMVGALCAVMSGHRLAAASLREVSQGLEAHEQLLTIDLGDRTGMVSRDQALWKALEQRSLRLLATLE